MTVSGIFYGRTKLASVNSTYAISVNDYTLECSGSSFTLTLPTAVGVTGKIYQIIHNGTNLTQVYTLNTTSSQTIGGVTSGNYALYTNQESLVLVSDGSNWIIVSHFTIVKTVSAGTGTYGAITTAPTKGTVVTDTVTWSRNGNLCTIRYNYMQSGAGSAGSGDYLVSLPPNISLDTNIITPYSTANFLPATPASFTSFVQMQSVLYGTTGSSNQFTNVGGSYMYNSTQFRVSYDVSGAIGANWGSGNNWTFAFATLGFTFIITIPVSGWQP